LSTCPGLILFGSVMPFRAIRSAMLISSERAMPDKVSPDCTTYVFGTAGLPDGLGDGDGLGDAEGEGLGVGDSVGLAVGVASTEGVGVASLGVVSVPIMEVRAGPTAPATGPLATVITAASTTTRSTRSHGEPFDGRGSAALLMTAASPTGCRGARLVARVPSCASRAWRIWQSPPTMQRSARVALASSGRAGSAPQRLRVREGVTVIAPLGSRSQGQGVAFRGSTFAG